MKSILAALALLALVSTISGDKCNGKLINFVIGECFIRIGEDYVRDIVPIMWSSGNDTNEGNNSTAAGCLGFTMGHTRFQECLSQMQVILPECKTMINGMKLESFEKFLTIFKEFHCV